MIYQVTLRNNNKIYNTEDNYNCSYWCTENKIKLKIAALRNHFLYVWGYNKYTECTFLDWILG